MRIFSVDSRAIEVWGPTTSVGVKIPSLGGIINNSWVLVNLSIGAREIVDIRQCFNDVSVIYALGNDQKQCRASLTFAIFVGRRACIGASNNFVAIQHGIDAYKNSRISTDVGMNSSTITIGDFSFMGWLDGIGVGNLDPEKGICYGTVNFIMELGKHDKGS